MNLDNITSVEKITDEGVIVYRVSWSNLVTVVPDDESNSDYKMIMEWVAEGNTITDNGGGA